MNVWKCSLLIDAISSFDLDKGETSVCSFAFVETKLNFRIDML